MDINSFEIWKDIKGLEGEYVVSNQGRVKSLSRVVIKSNGIRMTVRERVLSQIVLKGDYRAVGLPHGKRGYVHRLVCEAFHGPAPRDKPNALHNNGKPWDNQASNLRWGSLSDNNRDKRAHGTDHNLNKTHCPRKHELKEPNLIERILPYRECKSCAQERRLAYKQGRKFDPIRANERYEALYRGARMIR